MPDSGKRVFLSYRREVSWTLAHAVRGELVPHGFDVFLDTRSMDSGEFERVILHEIESRPHFLVLLEPRSLDRIADEGDWLRREVAHAVAHRRNVVPMLANGAAMPRSIDLPVDLARLPSYNAVSVPHEYFAEAMHKLRERFLRLDTPRTAVSTAAGRVRPAGPLDGHEWRRAAPLDPPTLSGRPLRDSPQGVTIGWTEVDGAAHYEVQVSPDATFARVYRSMPPSTHVFILHSHLTGDGDRFVRVRALAADDSAGPWSNTVHMF